jgi:hypothetical protein
MYYSQQSRQTPLTYPGLADGFAQHRTTHCLLGLALCLMGMEMVRDGDMLQQDNSTPNPILSRSYAFHCLGPVCLSPMSLWLPCGLHGFAVPNTVTVTVFVSLSVRVSVCSC